MPTGLRDRAFQRRAGALTAALFLSFSPLGGTPAATAGGIFAGMDGMWQGNGSIKWYSGENEAIRCKADNAVTKDGHQVDQTMTCASPSIGEPWKIKSSIVYREDAGIVNGTWSESKYGLNGNLSGNASPSKIEAQVEANGTQNIAVHVSVTTGGGRQDVSLQVTTPEGLTEISVNMMRKGSS